MVTRWPTTGKLPLCGQVKEPARWITFNVKDPANVKKLVDVNEDVLAVRLGDAEELWVTSKDGLKVQGWLIKPVDFDPAKKYPMVLWIHGGPWSMYSVAFHWAFQNFSANGYEFVHESARLDRLRSGFR